MPSAEDKDTTIGAELRLDSSTLPPECVQQMQAYLGTRRIVAQELDGGHQGTVLGVSCRVDYGGLGQNSPLVIVAARPKEDARWNFGDCFPRLPGVWDDLSAIELFRLRFLTLKKALWLFVWGRHVEKGQVRDHLAATAWFKEWAEQREVADTSEEGLQAFFDTLGFEARELQIDPQVGGRSDDGGSGFASRASEAKISRGGLFLWGDVAQTKLIGVASQPEGTSVSIGSAATSALPKSKREVQALGLFSELDHFLGGAGDLLFARATVKHEDGFPHLIVQLPPASDTFGVDPLGFENAAVYFSSPMYFSPEDTRVGVKGDFVFKDKRIHVDLQYPIDSDIIRGTGKYIGGPEHFLGDSASFGFPGPAPVFRADDEIELDLEFSKSDKTLTKLSFSLEMHAKHWSLIPAPVLLALEGVSFHVTIFEPLDKSRRAVMARIAAAATFGDEGEQQFRLTCGGSYPSGQLFLQSETSLPVGNLIEKLVGPSKGLDTLEVDDLRIEYNYRAKLFALEMDVKGPWEIVAGSPETSDASGNVMPDPLRKTKDLVIEDIRFRIQGDESYSGGLAARLEIAGVDVQLSALYDQGWQCEGSTGPDQEIPIDTLIDDLVGKFGTDKHIPASISGLKFENLHVTFNTATRDFTFTGEAKFPVDKHQVDIAVSIDIKHLLDGSVQKRFGGVITFGDYEFDLVFSDSDAKTAAAAAKPGADSAHVSTFLAAYRHTGGTAPGIRDLVKLISDDAKALVPNITTQSAFFAYQRQKSGTPTVSKWLFGINIEGGLNLSNIKLPELPLLSAGSPPDLSLKLDLQILVAGGTKAGKSKAAKDEIVFNQQEIALIGDLNATDDFSLPDGDLKRGVDLLTVLRMDGKVVPLNLPMKVTGDGVQDDSPEATAKPLPAEAPVDAVSSDDDHGLTQWVKIQKHFGPLHVERLGLHYESGNLGVLLDAGISVSGLNVSFNGLEVDAPLTKFDPHFHLSGIGIDYQGDAVEIGGAFLKRGDAYSGLAVLRTKQLALAAIGSYAKFHREPSLFIYAVLDYPLGGPPFFFVTGLAAGFGYNRRVIEPPVEEIDKFPLISEAVGGPAPLPADHEQASQTLSAKLASLDKHIPASLGDVFLAIGVKFTSFKLIDSFALLIGQFGERFELTVLGVSHFQLPSPEAGSTGSPLAEVFMDWKAVFRPDEGLLGLKAVLAPGSYVFRPDCQLTGGFAYYAWMSGQHAGDFVYTVGGYHPDFKKPAHYPDVDRLSLNWVLNDLLHLKGKAYYALTGHALMAGGSLDATMDGGFDAGVAGVHFHAHLHIGADFLMTWEPFHYDAQVDLALNIDISAHLLFFSKHFSLDVGADMHIWGPEFAGVAHVHLKVWRISHTLDVKFGSYAARLRPITWDRFCKAFLPVEKNGTLDKSAICSVAVKRGLIRTITDGEGTENQREHWVINPKEFALVTDSVIPIGDVNLTRYGEDGTSVFGDDEKNRVDAALYCAVAQPGVFPMGVHSRQMDTKHPRLLHTTHTIAITRDGKPLSEPNEVFKFIPVCKDVPASMWGKPQFEDEKEEFLAKPDVNADSLVKNTLAGVEVRPANPPEPGVTRAVDRHELQYECDRVANAYTWSEIDVFQADPVYAVKDSAPLVEQKKLRDKTWQLMKETVVQNQARDSILHELELGREAIYFGRELDEYMRDVPHIEEN